MKKYLLIFIGVLIASCTAINTPENALSYIQYNQNILENSVVYIASSNNHSQHGSGMVINSRTIVTAKHVAQAILSTNSEIQIRTKSGKVLSSRISVAMSSSVDVAVLFLMDEDIPVTPVPLSCNRAAVGDKIFAIGHPLAEEWIYTFGYISRNETDPQTQHQATTMPVANGLSGAPVFNSLGQFVGLVNSFLTISLPKGIMTPDGPIRFSDSLKAGLSLIVPADVVCKVYNGAKDIKIKYEKEQEQ